MKNIKIFKHALSMVLHSRLRSWLTIIGVVIGVAAVIAIMSIGDGMQQSLDTQFSGLGGDLLTITAGASRSGGFGMGFPGDRGGSQATEEEVVLDRTDLQAIKGVSGIALIDTRISGNVEVTYRGASGSVTLTGVDQTVWSQITTDDISEGRFLDSADQNVIVIGGRLAEDYFEQPLGLNKMITIEGSSFRIVGILDDTSTSIYMPLQMAYQILDDKEIDVYDTIIVKVKDEEAINETITAIEKKLMLVRHVTASDMDFSISSNKEVQETRSSMMSSMNAFLLAIAAVSLIVGSVGIANTMFTSVIEKTKEIGIMKAIGARNNDILKLFLFNSALIGLTGGLLGIILGILLSNLMPTLMPDMRMFGATFVSLNSIFLAISVSVGIGIIAGIVPAYKGSKLKPVDALRYE